MLNQIQQHLCQYYPTDSQFLIAFSGGLDSTVLLSLFAKLRQKQPHLQLRAIHIHHGLSPNADFWADHCQQVCRQLQIPLLLEKVDVQHDQGIEAGARQARYQRINQQRLAQEIVVTAHHQNDQTETFFLALKRGSGIQGLGAMQVKSELFNLPLFRPLLGFSRQQLEHYAQQENLGWIEDESNQDNRYERNFLRNQILPHLRQQWQHFDQAVQRSAQHCFEQQQLINELLTQEFSQIFDKNDRTLSLAHFSTYSTLKQNALLRHWFELHQLAMPSLVQLNQLINDVIFAQADRNPRFKLGNKMLRRYQHKLYLTPILNDVSQVKIAIELGKIIDLPDNLGKITIIKNGQKITALWQEQEQQYNAELPLPTENEQIWIKFHFSGKVKCRDNQPHKDIKKLWQKYNVPPWQRQRIPLIFYGETFKSAVGFFNNV